MVDFGLKASDDKTFGFDFFIDHFFSCPSLSMERQLICLNSWKSFFGRNSILRNIIFTP